MLYSEESKRNLPVTNTGLLSHKFMGRNGRLDVLPKGKVNYMGYRYEREVPVTLK